LSTTTRDVAATPVKLGGVRGGPDVVTLRKDRWWVQPWATVAVLTTFVLYTTFFGIVDRDYFVGAAKNRDLISPLYSPCVTKLCVPGSHLGVLHWWALSPALLVLVIPGGFRLTCYYYRKAYYRSFWMAPQACTVADAHGRYSGETRFPLIFQNIHRYFWYGATLFNLVLTADAILAFREPNVGGGGTWGVSVGTLVLCLNAACLWLYSLSCHACRHLCGGHVKEFSKHRIRHRIWKTLTPLNARHMQFAWLSLIVVMLTDLYVRLVAAGAFNDPKLF
jgi:hypothetical protein